jgi:hypothetical protein
VPAETVARVLAESDREPIFLVVDTNDGRLALALLQTR